MLIIHFSLKSFARSRIIKTCTKIKDLKRLTNYLHEPLFCGVQIIVYTVFKIRFELFSTNFKTKKRLFGIAINTNKVLEIRF